MKKAADGAVTFTPAEYGALVGTLERLCSEIDSERRRLERNLRLLRGEEKYRPDQLRWPAGSPGSVGGQFAPEDGAGGGFARYLRTGELAAADDMLSLPDRQQGYYGATMLPLVQDTPPPYPDGKIHVTQEDWDKFKGAVERYKGAVEPYPGLTEAERFSFMETYGAEGGMAVDRSSGASSGITPALMEKAKTDRVIPNSVAAPKDLTPDQRVAFYRWYHDTQALQRADGSSGLAGIGNHFTAAAVGDVMFREGGARGGRFARESVRDILRDIPERERRAIGISDEDVQKLNDELGVLKKHTLNLIGKLEQAGRGAQLRHEIAEPRDVRRTHEKWRNEHFRFRAMP